VSDADRSAMAEKLIAAAGDGLVAIDESGRIVVFNPAAGAIFGVEPEPMLGKTLENLFVPGMFVEHQRYVRDFLAGRGRDVVGTPIETQGWHSTGRPVPIEISLSAADVGGQRILLASIRDITRRRDADMQNRTLLDQLTQAKKLDAVGELAAGIAHDFNNMLGAILGYASAMGAEIDRTDRHYDDVAQIISIVRRAKNLTENLLTFTRQTEETFEPLSVNRLVREVADLLRRTLPKNIVIKTKLDKEVCAEGERSQLEQCLMNLCLNARDAMPDGGELQLQTSRCELDQAESASGLPSGPYCVVRVKDNGVGMDQGTLRRAFEPFFSTKSRGEGSGLGLSLVRVAMKNHHGHVQIESEPGRGTEVTIYLPAIDAQPSPEPLVEQLTQQQQQQQGVGETILLIDDEKQLRDMAKRLLEGLGYRVILAESGKEAVELFRRLHLRINLVLLDVLLVGMSSSETLDRLREIDDAVKVLVSSGSSPGGPPRQLLSKGVCGFIQKPYCLDEINQAIRQALARPSDRS
jgi:two-component system, cell cycle sensor histidine kinase and response regulator CckA